MTVKSFPGLRPETRVIDVGALDVELARQLSKDGLTRYLGLVPPSRLASIRDHASEYADRLQPLTSTAVFRCSTDLLFVRASHIRLLWAASDFGHVAAIAVEHGRIGAERKLAALVAEFTNKLRSQGRITLDGRIFEVFEVIHRRPPTPRTYFSPAWGPKGLARRLEEAGLQYSVLRWFEMLPAMDPGEDLDILVSDDDANAFRRLLEEEPGTMPVDLYSTSGLPGYDYHGAAYYPPDLAQGLLNRSVRHASGFRVPSPEDHFHSLAYHAVYHKGLRSGIVSTTLGTTDEEPEHDYHAVLKSLAAGQNMRLPATLEGLDTYLASVDWRPPTDALRRLAPTNDWVRAQESTDHPPTGNEAELTVFFVREATLNVFDLTDVIDILDHFGFDLVVSRELTDTERRRCATIVRGGNWGPGPYPRSGGGPAVMLIALHHAPDEVHQWLRFQYPRLNNLATYSVKQRLRETIDARIDVNARFNPIHSSDNEAEAWEYLRLTLPDEVITIAQSVTDRRRASQPPDDLVRELSRGRRARVDVIRGQNGLVVRKSFTATAKRHMEREVRAMTELHDVIPAVPPVLEVGANWFTCPYYSNHLADIEDRNRLVPVAVMDEMVATLRQFHENGFDLVDARPQNFLFDCQEGLKIVDFEFLYEYRQGERPTLAESYNFHNSPPGLIRDIPVGDQSYELRWLPFVGIPLKVLIDGSTASKHVHRILYRIRRATVVSGSPLRRPFGRARQSGREVLHRGFGAYKARALRWAVTIADKP